MQILLIIFSLFSLLGCSTQSKLDAKYGPLKTVSHVDIPKFMGTWYVIANIPTFIEEDAYGAVETYTWNEEKKRIDVDFRFNKDDFDGPLKEYPQKAWIHNTTTNAEWRIQLFWPFKFPYLVLDLASDYSYTVIGVPDRAYIWIMARSPSLDQKVIDSIKEKMTTVWGFETTKLQMVPQRKSQ